ncbi:MAG: CDGSH iron-sulfur domain-containing protein [Myxococcales bacterium]|nr:CDGSH iron-sulfur domain-containing protein [Myxococcales bacterium]
MPKPNVAERSPAVLELAAGQSYWWCRCGASSEQPWCDGSHNAKAEFQPMEFTVEAGRRYALCRCKNTSTPPFCDGSHKQLPEP